MAEAVEAGLAAYVIEWGPKTPCKIKRLPLPSAVDGTTDSASTGSSIGTRAEALRRAWGIAVDTDDTAAASSAPTSRLFVVRDMDSEDANRIMCTALDVDPAFVDCHIARRRYHPQDRQWRIHRYGHHRSHSDSGGAGGGSGGDGGSGGGLGRADAPGLASFMTRAAYSYVYPEVLTLTVLKTEPGSAFDSGLSKEAAGAGQDEGYRTGRAGASGPRTAEERQPSIVGARGVGGLEAGPGLRVSTATTAAVSISQLSEKVSRDLADAAGEVKGKAFQEQSAGTTSQMASRRTPLTTSKAPFLKRSDSGESTVAVFCRASVWTGPTAHVLFLDSSPSSTTLEDALTDTLDEAMVYDSALSLARTGAGSSEISTPEATADLVNHVVAALAYDQWLDFFDSISSSSQNTSYANRKLYWDMCHYLEQNLTVSRFHEKKQRLVRLQQTHRFPQPLSEELSLFNGLDVASVDDWQGLLARLERLVALLPLKLQKQKKTTATSSSLVSPETSFHLNRMATGDVQSISTRHPAPVGEGPPVTISSTDGNGNGPDNQPYSATDDGQAALSRVTYMGGILLPFSIVSGILSMSDPFGPGNPLFWVFWVITLPLTLFTVFIIYADGIRKAEVWVEVASDNIQEAISKGQMLSAAAAAAAFGSPFGIDEAAAEPGHESDLDVETGPVASAMRRSGHRGRRQHSVPVSTACGSRSKIFYRLSEPPSPIKTRPTTTLPVPASASPPAAHPAKRTSAASSVEGLTTAQGYSRKRRSLLSMIFPRHKKAVKFGGRPQPLPGRVPTTASAPLFGPGDDTVVIDMGPTMGPEASGGPGAEYPSRPLVVLEHANDGSKPKVWRRQQLGWYGAAKSIVGYQKPRKHMSPPAEYVRVERHKTRTY